MFIPFLLAIVAAAPAQVVSFGVRAGVPVTNAVPGGYEGVSSMSDTGRWTVGPTVEFHLPLHLSIEADALYRGYRSMFTSGFNEFIVNGTSFPPSLTSYYQETRAWDIPVLVKYHFNGKRIRPFIGLGIQSTHESSDSTSYFQCLGTQEQCTGSALNQFFAPGIHHGTFRRWHSEPTAGVGIEVKVGKFHVSPEVRYTRIHQGVVRNQASVLVGFTF